MATREVKDALDLSTGNPVYFRSHAMATYMSDGSTVEDRINMLSNANSDVTTDGLSTVIQQVIDTAIDNELNTPV